MEDLEEVLMREGVAKFADPQKALLKLLADRRKTLANRPSRRERRMNASRPLILDAIG